MGEGDAGGRVVAEHTDEACGAAGEVCGLGVATWAVVAEPEPAAAAAEGVRDKRESSQGKKLERRAGQEIRSGRGTGYSLGSGRKKGRDEELVLFEMALESAMRLREMYTLTWDQVDFVQRTIFLDKTKNGDKRQVPLTTVLLRVLQEYRGTCIDDILFTDF